MFAIWLSFALRLGDIWSDNLQSNLWILILIPVVSIPIFMKLGLYRSVLKFMGTKVIVTAFQAITITSLILGFVMMIFRVDLPNSNSDFFGVFQVFL